MAGAVIWTMLLGVIGLMVGAMCRSTLVRTVWTVVFGLSWFGMLGGRGVGVLIVLVAGIGVFLVGMWIGAAMAKNTAIDRIAGATTDELHEAMLSLIDEHGIDHRWIRAVWMRMEDEEQRRWVRQHRSEIKQALKVALDQNDIAGLWDRLGNFGSGSRRIPPPPRPNSSAPPILHHGQPKPGGCE